MSDLDSKLLLDRMLEIEKENGQLKQQLSSLAIKHKNFYFAYKFNALAKSIYDNRTELFTFGAVILTVIINYYIVVHDN